MGISWIASTTVFAHNNKKKTVFTTGTKCLLLDFVDPTYLALYCKSRRSSSLHTTTFKTKLFLVLQKADYIMLGVLWRVVIAHKRSIKEPSIAKELPQLESVNSLSNTQRWIHKKTGQVHARRGCPHSALIQEYQVFGHQTTQASIDESSSKSVHDI